MKKYNIMTSCNNDLADYLAIGLTAMSRNLKDAEIDFYLFHSKVGFEKIKMLNALCIELSKSMVGGYIHFHEILVPNADVYDELAKFGNNWPGEAYYSLCAHLLLPDNVDRVLYLDAGDTLIVGDIEPYYHYDFQGKSLIVTGSQYKLKGNEMVLYEPADLGNWNEYLPYILRGIFNSGSYIINLEQMRKDRRILEDYQYLSLTLQQIFGSDNNKIYFGDQGLLSAAFVGDVRYYAFPEIRDLWYMPYNFCLWYYDRKNQKPEYSPVILHFAGTAFKPWKGTYPIFLDRFQKEEELHTLEELKNGQSGYFYLWHEYAIVTDAILRNLGWN